MICKHKKICHITTVHGAFDARIFFRECKSLVDEGYEVYLVASNEKEEVVEGVHILPLSTTKNRLYRFFVKDLTAFIKAIRVNCDLYHFHDPELIWVGIMLKVCRKKVIYDVHENVSLQILSKYWIPFWMRKIFSFFFGLIERFSIKFFDKVIVAGEDISKQSYFRKFNYKTFVINNFPIVVLDDNDVASKKFDTIKFIYTGNISEERGVFEIIGAANLISNLDFKLTLMGVFESKKVEDRVLFEIKSNERIEYLPAVPYRELFIILSKYNVGIICFKPTPNNIGAICGRNNKIFEYLQAGLAVIASDIPEWRDFVQNNEIGLLVDPNNSKSISVAMKSFILNKQLLKEMSKNSRALSCRYSWESQRKILLDIYREVLK